MEPIIGTIDNTALIYYRRLARVGFDVIVPVEVVIILWEAGQLLPYNSSEPNRYLPSAVDPLAHLFFSVRDKVSAIRRRPSSAPTPIVATKKTFRSFSQATVSVRLGKNTLFKHLAVFPKRLEWIPDLQQGRPAELYQRCRGTA